MRKIRDIPFGKFYSTLVIFAIIITITAIIYVLQNKLNKDEAYLNENISTLDMAYRASIEKYENLIHYFYATHINNEQILNLFAQGADASGDEQRLAKALLYKELYPLYEKLKLQNISQFNFHLKNNKSYLRFSKPDTYGNDVSGFRNTVKKANKENKIVKSFETGRFFSGYRYVFPLNYKSRYIGSVEFSLAIKTIIDTITHLDSSREYAYVLKSDVAYSKLLEKQKYLYTQSIINPNFVQEDPEQILDNSPKKLSIEVEKINEKLKNDIKLQKAMENGEKFASFVHISRGTYSVSFLPLGGVEKNIEGYMISYKREKKSRTSTLFIVAITLMVFGLVIFLILISAIHKKSKDLIYQKEWFKSITDALGEGLYVMDTNATIQYVNPIASKLLGYSKEELLGENAHHLFHSHPLNHNSPVPSCPRLKEVMEKGEFTSAEEYFRHKNGKKFPIEVSSIPIIKENDIIQIVTLFRDISEKRALEMKTNILTKALEVSINAVIITDKNAMTEWANPAYEKMSGFTLKEVLGKNTKDLVNSGKQSKEFYKNMWKTLLKKQVWEGELINKRKNGRLYHEELHIAPILDKEGEIEYFVAVKQDISRRKKREEKIEHFAFYDVLTNLPNRRLLGEHLQKIIHAFPRQNKHVAILYLDLDKFKALNDTKGHDAGDELLKQAAYRINKLMRREDIVARIGGDEFVIVLDDLSKQFDKAAQNTKIIAEKIRKTINTPFNLKIGEYQASTSIGIYLFSDDTLSMEELLENADTALYAAKLEGKNAIRFFNQ